MMNVELIKFLDVSRSLTPDLVEFKLGHGPCGRWVARLVVEVSDHLVTIRQDSYDADVSEARDEARELANASVNTLREQIRLRELTAALRERHRRDTFVYKISDVKGRLHMVDSRTPVYRD